MKDKIFILIIGILIGAIITTSGFLIYKKSVSFNNFGQQEIIDANGNNQMEKPDFDGNMGEPPSKPNNFS